MKKFVAVILLISMCAGLFADPIKYEYEPYSPDEFSSWTMELRRAEIIFFGSLVITLPISMAIYSIGSSFGMPTPDSQALSVLYQFAGAAGLSLLIAGTDWIIGKTKNDKK